MHINYNAFGISKSLKEAYRENRNDEVFHGHA